MALASEDQCTDGHDGLGSALVPRAFRHVGHRPAHARRDVGAVDGYDAAAPEILQASIDDFGPRGLVAGIRDCIPAETREKPHDHFGAVLGGEPQRLLDHVFDLHARKITHTAPGP